jgi:pimeloyl-ACP methyl ester carboxylesterase
MTYIIKKDGRKLFYHDHAPENSETIIFFHGVPSDHSSVLSLPGFPFIENFRIILLDRPGYGESNSDKRMGYSRLKDDIEELTKHLGIEQFYVEGVSGGAPWALGVAVNLSNKVKGVVLVSPMGPLTDEVMKQINKVNRNVYKVARSFPFLMRINVATIGFILRHFPEWYLKKMDVKMSSADIRDIKKPGILNILKNTFLNSVKQTSFGMYQDVINQAMPYDFDISRINCPVVIFQSEEDYSTPKAVGDYYKEQIKNSKIHHIEDAGHLWHCFHMSKILKQSIAEIDAMREESLEGKE